MPQFIPVLLSAAATAAGATALTAAFIALGASLVVSNYSNSRAKKKARDQFNAAQVDRLVNVASTTAPRELVLGRVRKGGHVFFRGSVGQYREKFVMLIALADHEIDGVERIYLNDVPVDLDADGYVTTAPYMLTRKETRSAPIGSIPPEAIPASLFVPPIESGVGNALYQVEVQDPKARIRIFTGSPTQAAAADVVTDFPELWTADHRARGVAYLHCEFWYDETAFPSGLPNVTAIVRGARCFDPRTGATAWTQNPAVMMRHVLTHPAFGKRTSLSAAEDAQIVAAANACDTPHNYFSRLVSWIPYVSIGPVPLYRAATVIPYGSSARDALDDLAQAMAGQWAYAAGAFFVRAGVYTAPVMALTEADLAVVVSDASGSTSQQSISISTHRARNDKFNVVTATIWDSGQDYKQTALTPLKGAALIARDGAELVQDVAMPAVFSAFQAKHIAGVAMRDARDPLTISIPLKLRAYPLQLFDVVTLTLPRYGWAAKQFVVLARQWSVDGMILLTLKETSATITQPDAEFDPEGSAKNTALPNPWEIEAPTVTSISSGTADLLVQSDGTILPRVRVQWAALADPSVGSVEVQWQLLGTAAATWRSESVPRGETQAFLVGAVEGSVLAIRVRTRNSLAVSDWTLQQYHTVVGKTEPPSTVAAVSVSGKTVAWEPVKDTDLAGYLLRFQYGENTWWDSAAPMHDGIITESPYALERVPEGPCTVMVKAVDTSGNESLSAVFSFYTFPSYATSNILLSYAEHPAFAGEVTGGALVAGELLADALDRFYEPADGPMYLPSTEAMYVAGQYAPMAYEFAVTPANPGTLALQTAITGAYTIEYQTGGADPMFEPAGDPLYEPLDEALFGTPSAWQLWPGSLQVDGALQVRFRITLAAGELRGEISEVTAVLDVPDIAERLAAVSIASGGTRLPIASTYYAIKTVHLTVHGGGTATSARILDKDPALGPLVQVINASGTAVAGTVDADIQGY